MGVLDVVAKTVLSVKVEGTAEAKAQLKSLQGAEREVAEARVAGLEAGNKGLEKWIGMLGQFGVAIAAAKVGFDAFKEYAHHLDQESAAAGVSIGGLAKAAHGLKDNMELLEHAAILNKSAFKLTQDQMETVETAMRALEARGRDGAEVWQAMEAAVTKGATKPLEQFGIIVDKTGLAVDENGLKLDTYGQKQQALGRIMEGLKKTAQEVEGEQMNAADQTSQQIVRLQNLWNDAKLKLGELVADIGSKLLPVLAASVERAVKLVSMLTPGASQDTKDFIFGGGILKYQDQAEKSIDKFFGTETVSSGAGIKNAIEAYKAEQAARPLYATDAFGFGQSQASGEVDVGKFQGALTSLYQFSVKFDDYQKRKSGPGGRTGSGESPIGATSLDRLPGAGGFSTSLGAAADSGYHDSFGATIDLQSQINGIGKALDTEILDKMNAAHERRVSLLESVIGPISQFDLYKAEFEKLGEVFNAFSGAVGAGYEAIVKGSGGIGAAIKHAFADGLMAMGKSSAIEALRETALGFGSLALGPLGGASATAHFTAAGMHAAVAVAAGVAAHSMGAGSSSSSSTAAKPAPAPSTSGGKSSGAGSNSGTGSGTVQTIIVYSEAFYSESNRMRQLDAQRLVKQALGNSGAVHS